MSEAQQFVAAVSDLGVATAAVRIWWDGARSTTSVPTSAKAGQSSHLAGHLKELASSLVR